MWRDQFAAGLAARDAEVEPFAEIFEAFAEAASRATAADEPEQQSMAGQLDAERERAESYRFQATELREKLTRTQKLLDQAQERLRSVAEEHYLRTHSIQGLHDEILALTMQLNLLNREPKSQDIEL